MEVGHRTYTPSMPLPVAINGVGRIGRAFIRQLIDRPDLRLVATNDLAPVEQIAGLLQRDTFHGPFPGEIGVESDGLVLDGQRVPFYSEPDAASIPWQADGPAVVIEATGGSAGGTGAKAHLRDAVRHVILSSNSPQAEITVCYGVNHELIEPERHRLISNASCTTNCLAVVAHLIEREIGIERALLNTVHCYNNSQNLVDAPHIDPRRARSATTNMVPTTTGASTAIGRVLPALADRLDGFAVRVPAAQVSLIDLVVDLRTDATPEALNDLFRQAAERELQGILSVSEAPLVSSDFIGDTHSAIVDLQLTQVVGARLARVVAWYDNEMGYASRLADLATWLGRS